MNNKNINEQEQKNLSAFCRYLRKNPELFRQNGLHGLMLEDQNKKAPLQDIKEEPEIKLPEEIASKPEKLKRKKKEPKEKKERKPRKKKEKLPAGPESNPAPDAGNAQGIALKPDAVQDEKSEAL